MGLPHCGAPPHGDCCTASCMYSTARLATIVDGPASAPSVKQFSASSFYASIATDHGFTGRIHGVPTIVRAPTTALDVSRARTVVPLTRIQLV